VLRSRVELNMALLKLRLSARSGFRTKGHILEI
jgi:hypothetical protein